MKTRDVQYMLVPHWLMTIIRCE